MAASTETNLASYHIPRFGSYGKPSRENIVETFYAYQLGPLTAAVAAHGVTNVWQGMPVIPLANNDEIHFAWKTPNDLDVEYPIKVRWGLISNAATKALTITTTYDRVIEGTTVAADGATAFNDTIPAIATGDNPGANIPFNTKWGKINGTSTEFDILFIKGVASGATTADAVRVTWLQFAYTPLTA